MDGREVGATAVGVDDRVPLARAALYGLQHVTAMFAGLIAVPLIVSGAIGLGPSERTILVQGALITSGVATLLQTGRVGMLGARLPIAMGTAFVFITPLIAIGSQLGVAAMFGAVIVGGLVELAVSPLVWRVKRLFPPLVTGTVVALIGLSLIPIGFRWAAGGSGPLYGQPIAFAVSGLVLAIMIVSNQYVRGFLQTVSVIFAIACGYVISALAGILDVGAVREAPWFAVPSLFAFGAPEFSFGAIIGILAAQFASMLETIGDVYATGTMTRTSIEKEHVRGAIAIDGLGSAFAAVLNGLPVTSFSQNIGVIGLTGVASRQAVRAGGVILLVLGLFPKFAAAITAMPDPVLGGVALVMFGAVAAAGIGQLRGIAMTQREVLIFATAIGLGLGLGLAEEAALERLPAGLRVLLHSGVIVGGVVAILLNEVLPGRRGEGRPGA